MVGKLERIRPRPPREVVGEGDVKLPADGHRLLADVAPVAGGNEEPKGPVGGREAGQQQGRAAVALVVLVAQVRRAVLLCRSGDQVLLAAALLAASSFFLALATPGLTGQPRCAERQ